MEGVTSLIEIDSEGKNRSSRIRYYSYPTLPLEPIQSKSFGGRVRTCRQGALRVGPRDRIGAHHVAHRDTPRHLRKQHNWLPVVSKQNI